MEVSIYSVSLESCKNKSTSQRIEMKKRDSRQCTYPAVLGVAFAATAFEVDVALLLRGAATDVPIKDRVNKARNFMMKEYK